MSEKQMENYQGNSEQKIGTALPLQRLRPAVDIYETAEQLVFVVDLPGIDEQALQIEVDRGLVTLEADQTNLDGTARNNYYRQFKLPEQFDSDAADAALKDGVLTLRFSKAESAKPKKITVKTLH